MTYTKCSQYTGEEPTARSVNLLSALRDSRTQDVWGEMHISSNGESHMSFMLNIHLYRAMDNSLIERWENQAFFITTN